MPNLTELLYEIGGGSFLAASALADSYPPEVKLLTRFNSLPLDLEKIVSISPDLVFAVDGLNSPDDADRLEELGIPSYFLSFESLIDISKAMSIMGVVLGLEDQALIARERFEKGLKIDSLGASLSGELQTEILVLNSLEVLYSFGKSSYANELVTFAGGTLATSSLDDNAVVLNDEFVLSRDPDIIVLAFPKRMSTSEILELRPNWKKLKAIRNESFYTLHPDILLRPGPRIVQAVDSLRSWIGNLEAE